MVDNVTTPLPDGDSYAFDDVGGVKLQRVKATWGPDGTMNDADVASGKAMPVQLRSATGLIPFGEPTDAKATQTDTTSVTAISIWKQISASVQAIASSIAGTLTVATHAVTQSGTWNVTVNAAIAAGSNVIGGITAAASAFADGALVTLGSKTDAKATQTDTTSVSGISIWKQISASVQAIASSIAGTLTVGTHAVTQSGTWNVTVNAAIAAGSNVIGGITAAASAFADGALVTLGAKADAKSTATDTTSVSLISIAKQISASVQALVTAIGSTAWDLGSGTSGTRTQRVILDSGQLAANATTAQAMSAGFQLVSTPTDATTSVGGRSAVRSLTLSLDTSPYASGDVLADTQIYDAFFRITDGTAIINSLTVVDEDDQGVAFDVYLFSANSALGTENGAPSISDANARTLQGIISVAAADYKDLGGVKVAFKGNLGIPVKAASGTDDLYVGVVNGSGAPTFTASGVKLLFGVMLD